MWPSEIDYYFWIIYIHSIFLKTVMRFLNYKLHSELFVKYDVGLKALLLQDMSEPVFYGQMFSVKHVSLLVLMLYAPVNIFSVMSGRLQGFNTTEQRFFLLSCSRTEHTCSSESPTSLLSFSTQG